jgi:hypothetical protein
VEGFMKGYRDNQQINDDSSSWVADALASLVETKDLQTSQLESLQAELAKVTAERDAFKTDAQSLQDQLAKVTAERDSLKANAEVSEAMFTAMKAERDSLRADTQSSAEKLLRQAVLLGSVKAEKTKMQKDLIAIEKAAEAFVAYSDRQAHYLQTVQNMAKLSSKGFNVSGSLTGIEQPIARVLAEKPEYPSLTANYSEEELTKVMKIYGFESFRVTSAPKMKFTEAPLIALKSPWKRDEKIFETLRGLGFTSTTEAPKSPFKMHTDSQFAAVAAKYGFKYSEASAKTQSSEPNYYRASSADDLYGSGDADDLYGDTADIDSKKAKDENPIVKPRRV